MDWAQFLKMVSNKILLFRQDQVNSLVANAGDPLNDKEMAKALQKAIGISNSVFFENKISETFDKYYTHLIRIGERCCT